MLRKVHCGVRLENVFRSLLREMLS